MGYRLNINVQKGKKLQYIFYGTKLYGYCDETKLSSYNYLCKIKKFEGNEIFDYCCANQIELNYIEYITFVCLYNQDLNNFLNYIEEKDYFINNEEIRNSILKRYSKYIIQWI